MVGGKSIRYKRTVPNREEEEYVLFKYNWNQFKYFKN